ncbi:hypothetical protein HMSSN036_15050 [Paenibacillus macerans]|nr:hypothetical protein HMSSN036_15050 [Paenibacillus macerans]
MAKSLHETNDKIQDIAVLVSLITPETKQTGIDPSYSLDELVRLAETAGVEVAETAVQNRDKPDPRWLIGKGKVLELRELMDRLRANTAIFDQELSGAQVRNLEEMLDAKIIDRTQLILDILPSGPNAGRDHSGGAGSADLSAAAAVRPRQNLSRLGGGIGTRDRGKASWRWTAAISGAASAS